MGKTKWNKRKVIGMVQFVEKKRNGERKSFIDSVIEKGGDAVNTTKIDGNTLLSCATEFGSKEIVEHLLENGASSSATNVDGSIPLHIAAQHDHMDLLKIFINLSVFVDSRDKMNRTPLHYVTGKFSNLSCTEKSNTLCGDQEKHLELASFLLDHGADIDARDSKGNVPILLAAKHSCKRVFNMLLRRGANIQCCDEYKWTVMHYAASRGWLNVVKRLVERGADIDACDNQGNVAILLAAKNSYKCIVELLVKKGANTRSCDKNKWTVLHYAASLGWPSVVQRLVDADIDARDNKGNVAILLAAKNLRRRVVEMLVKGGANIQACDDRKWTVLHYAASCGWLSVVQCVVERRADMNATDNKGNVPLLLAAKKSHKSVVELLVKEGADTRLCDERKWTVLHYASSLGWLTVVQNLVERKADLDAVTRQGVTSLLLAAQNSHVEVVELLIKSGVNVNICDWEKTTLLHHASREGWLNVVKLLVEYKADINAKTYCDSTPVYLAAKKGHMDVFNFLVKSGADLMVGYDNNVYKKTILHYACEAGWVDAVQSIVDWGFDIDVKTRKSDTPLLIAAKHADKDILDILLTSGASLHIFQTNSLSLLHYACRNGWMDFVQCLVDAGWDINSKTPDGRTSLMLAAENDHLKLFEYLLETGADIDAKMLPCRPNSKCENSSNYCDDCYYDKVYSIYDWGNFDDSDYIDYYEDVPTVEEWTILHYASSIGQLPLVLFLISKGANANVQTSKGVTPLHLAVEMGNLEVAMHLLKAGADVNAKTSDGSNPLYLAVVTDHPEIVAHLLNARADFNVKCPRGITPLYNAVEGDYMESAEHLLRAGANCNEKVFNMRSAFECFVEDLYQKDYIPLFLEKGAYITDDICCTLMEGKLFKETILTNVEYCTKVVLNKFNYFDLPQLYQVPFAVKNLPPLERIKLGNESYLARSIKDSVLRDIEANGHCNITKIQPMVLSVLAAKSFIKHINDRNVYNN